MRIAFSGEFEGTAEESKQTFDTMKQLKGITDVKLWLPDNKPSAEKPSAGITIDRSSLPAGSSISVSPQVKSFVEMAPRRVPERAPEIVEEEWPLPTRVITRITPAKPTIVFQFRDATTGDIVGPPHQTVKTLDKAIEAIMIKASRPTLEAYLINEKLNGRKPIVEALGTMSTQDEARDLVNELISKHKKSGKKYVLDALVTQLSLNDIQIERH